MSYRHWLIMFALLSVALLGVGCRRAKGPEAATAAVDQGGLPIAGEVMIFIPCGVAGPYGDIAKLFQAKYPGVKVKQQMANIDVQVNLILDGKATPDAWIALGDQEMQRVQQAGKVEGEPITFAYNSIAFLVHKNNPLGIMSVQDLAKPGVKTIAMASPQNSSGYYGEQAFRKAGVWDGMQEKLWLTDQPAQIKAQLSMGKAQVGIVYYPCARETRIMGGKPEELGGKLQLLNKLPDELSGSFPAQCAVIKGAANPQAGQAFLDFMMTDEAQDVWEKWAFTRAKQPKGGRVVLYMYCGAGLRPMMDAAVEQFKQVRPSVRIDVGYAGSGCLLSQLTFGKRGDLYVPGEDFYLDQATAKGYIRSSKLAGGFEPVLLVQKGNPKGIKGVEDLARAGLKVGIGEPKSCAVGVAAEKLLRKANLYDKIKPNIAVLAGNVPELGNMVQLKALDVAIVWNITAAQQVEKCDAIPVVRSYYEPSQAPIGLLDFTKHEAEAQAFIDFITSPEGQGIVKGSGMSTAAELEQPKGT